MMTPSIALVGLSCVYPDARSPAELWENVLAGRRAFRQIPPERIRVEDYWSADRGAADRTYAVQAALIEGYEFDRVGFRVSGESFRAADLAHWLALDVAARALKDAGLEEGLDLPRDTTGVFLGNTLTGEFSRANVLRLRWPYARRVTEAALRDEGWSSERIHDFLGRLEAQFKEPFPPVGEETLAGGLSNTIAGRICNHFDFKGGGYTVDGACASSLLAVAHACSALAAGDLDVALAGGVDLSIDPFELVGFAKAGALASNWMRVYDARSDGFWPGEGCGVVVLMRLADAIDQGRRVVAVIRGWGISSDGHGGITRPEVEGQLLAIRRAYRRAGLGIDTVAYFEGHGTGTTVGDATELRALGRALREAGAETTQSTIGSIKANIGHTKAAAGVAGLIKAALALEAQILPPTTGCDQPHPELTGDRPVLSVLKQGRAWPADRPLRAGGRAMGFGGINAHVVLESLAGDRRRPRLSPVEDVLLSSTQDAELFLLGARDSADLRRQVADLLVVAGQLSLAALTDLAAHLAESLEGRVHTVRAAIVASHPAELKSRLESLRTVLEHASKSLDPKAGVFLGQGECPPRIGFLFPGQGSPATLDGGAWGRRFSSVRDLYQHARLPRQGDPRATEVAQPAIIAASVAALALLRDLNIEAETAVGHSLGELTALHWAGAFDAETLLRIAEARGKAMAELTEGAGAMASLSASRTEVEALLNGEPVVIAGLNAPRQTVISGPSDAVDAFVSRAKRHGYTSTGLSVSHAFHSPMVAGAVTRLAQAVALESIKRPSRSMVSTVTGTRLPRDVDIPRLLLSQVTSPVHFLGAMSEGTKDIDLWIEAGPGRILTGLAAGWIPSPVIAIEAGAESVAGLLHAAGAAYALGVPLNTAILRDGRWSRPFPINWRPRFFANPCELAPVPVVRDDAPDPPAGSLEPGARVTIDAGPVADSVLERVRWQVAARAELPIGSVKDDSRFLSDLHLNSITVSQLVVEMAGRLGCDPPKALNAFANATIAEVAAALEDLARAGRSDRVETSTSSLQGVAPWFRVFTTTLIERPPPRRRSPVAPAPRRWQVVALPGNPLADRLREAMLRAPAGPGVMVCLPPNPDERHVGLLLEAARARLADPDAASFVLVQHGGGASSFARTLHLEASRGSTCVVDVPAGHPRSVEWVVAEAEAAFASRFIEVHYDKAGRRWEPVLRLQPLINDGARVPLRPGDVVLVTGGGKGIAAECGLSLARETGVRLALLGRSHVADDRDLTANLERMAASGVEFRYLAADVTDADAVRGAVKAAESALGPITAVVHGAGVNVPRLLHSLDDSAFVQTLAPKVKGAHNILGAVRAHQLKLLVTFGSIIARTGLPGEADYGLANEWLTRLTEQFQKDHPSCRCLALEWSVWSGVGMGDRLGRVEALARQGITPIPTDEGVSLFRRLVSSALPVVPLMVSGRFGIPPALEIEASELPLLRFLERPLVDYPGIELVADATLTGDSDPYLDDHVFRGERLFPAVMGLEAMAQAAMAVLRVSEPPVFEDVRFDRPIVVPAGRSTTIRLAALVSGPGRVDVVVRSETTAFQFDHFRAGLPVQRCESGRRSGEWRSGANGFLPRSALPALRSLFGAESGEREVESGESSARISRTPEPTRTPRRLAGVLTRCPDGTLRVSSLPRGSIPASEGLSAAAVDELRRRDRGDRAGNVVPRFLADRAGCRRSRHEGRGDSCGAGLHSPGDDPADRGRSAHSRRGSGERCPFRESRATVGAGRSPGLRHRYH